MLWPKALPLDLDFRLCAWAKLFNEWTLKNLISLKISALLRICSNVFLDIVYDHILCMDGYMGSFAFLVKKNVRFKSRKMLFTSKWVRILPQIEWGTNQLNLMV